MINKKKKEREKKTPTIIYGKDFKKKQKAGKMETV